MTPEKPGVAAAALAAVSDAVLGLAGELALDPVLEGLVHAARDLVGARYAALGVPDDEGTAFDRFITAGMSDELIEAIGPLPRTHGLLAAMLTDPEPYRTDDIAADPRFQWWPAAHPRMGSFLGVPIVFKDDVIAAFYLTDKDGGFDGADEEVMGILAAHAAVVIEHARLYEASRQLSIVEERNRLARDLHDALSQTLFSLGLTVEAAASLVAGQPDRAASELARAGSLVAAAVAELRSAIFELRPPDLDDEGLVATVAKHAELVTRAHGVTVSVDTVLGDAGADPRRIDPEAERQLLRVIQEALNNVVRHAAASRARVTISVGDNRVTVVVADDGIGFEPTARAIPSRRLGLTSMRERVEALGGSITVRSAPGAGTTVRAEVPRG